MKSPQTQQRLFIGALLIALGLIALVGNFGFFSPFIVFQFWPTVFIVLGLIKLTKAMEPQDKLWGMIFIGVGVIMTLNTLNIIHFSFHQWWPVILILVGLHFLMKRQQHDAMFESQSQPLSDAFINATYILSGTKSLITSQDFRGGQVTVCMGGAELNLREASIQSNVTIDITAIMGGIELKVPRDWVVINNTTCLLGGVQNSTVPTIDATKKLIITGLCMMGGVEIKN